MSLIPGESQPGFTELFAQLGLPNDPASIQQFIEHHSPLPEGMLLHEAPCWTQQQAQMLRERLYCDDDWAIVIDQLNAALHEKPDLNQL